MEEPKPLSAQYVRDQDWFDAHLNELVEKYPDKWVAVVNEQVVAVSESRGDAHHRANKLHPDAEPVVWLMEATITVPSALGVGK